ncbi:MAG: hypothetical protein J6W75_09755 [Bacteroidaceae bacterium]|nr:hypothetical protein [Bacteroidaceae bacterium]
MESLTTYIRHPERLDASAVGELAQLVERAPFFQPARLLLVRGLYQLQDEHFGQELRRAALSVPDRSKLFELIEGQKYKPTPERRHDKRQQTTEPTVDRTQSLINLFLSQQTEEPQPRKARPVDASVDYMSYLMQMEDAEPTEEQKEVAVIKEIDSVPQKKERTKPVETLYDDDDELAPSVLDENGENEPSEAFFTETLARIYIKQGKYGKAIEIIRRLSLNFPKKNRYFADQIRFLEKLLINEESKNT